MHVYREGFDDRVAFLLPDVPGWGATADLDDVTQLQTFLRFCGVDPLPAVQTAV